MSTNGTHAATSSESSNGTLREHPPVDGRSVDERLEALRETIRTWDWRAALVEVGPTRIEALDNAAPPLNAPSPAEVRQSDEPLVDDELSPDGIAGAKPVDMSAPPGPVAIDAPPTAAVALPLDIEALELDEPGPPLVTAAPPAQATTPSDQAAPPTETLNPPASEVAELRESGVAPTTASEGPATEEILVATEPLDGTLRVDQSVQQPGGDGHGIGTSWFEQEPELAPEPKGASRRLWSHPWAKLAVAVIVAVVIVALIVGGIRFFAKTTTSGGTNGATVVRPSSHPVRHAHFVVPISAAQLATYEGFASSFQNANVTATKGFIKAGSSPTPSQVVLVVVAYRTAVNLYNYQLHFVHWPQSMQSALETDHAQLQALTSFLQAFSSVAPNGVPAWLSQLHERANSTQVADNAIREDVGLPASYALP